VPLRVVEGCGLCEDGGVPLSEDEQRILSQIEDQLYESDPELAREVGSTTVYTHASRNLRWAVFGFVVGLTVMILTLSISFWLAFGGFAIMLAAALYFEQNARRLGRAGLQQLSQSVRSSGLRNIVANPGSSLRDRIRDTDDGDETPKGPTSN
jgi:hypothetical protein